jgi:hypothetical protein
MNDVIVVHGDYPRSQAWDSLVVLVESLGVSVDMENVSVYQRMAAIVDRGCAAILEESRPKSLNTASAPVCPGMEKCEHFGACGDCIRHPILRDKWLGKPAYVA